ncbi:aldo/keto reductase [Homoserinibacter sp. YIM 151385]|uniref:aldo/keto reductase n=1 Tax=Homoserinibacter sp. YIM 151385 TaxID=2985506 RepID=UPI0022F06165|nr:aldo/keto reductase [Homoserinibacter sp. YIM 151385]WBU37929.1 aldo/keto reductase [Homoserinibacter sp. YIM 151385]
MKTLPIPALGRSASSVVLGLMRIAELDDEQIRTLVRTAIDHGVDVFDHADIYGGERHRCEERFGESGAIPAASRGDVIIQSKVGIRPGMFDFSYEHIIRTVDESLAALRTDYLDLLLLHRPDTLVEPEEVARAFSELQAAGKVRAFGVSNHTPGQIELLRRSLPMPIAVNQVQLSITHAPIIAQGLAANMAGLDQSIDRDGGMLDYARLHDITLQAWSPFQKGFFDGVFVGDREAYPELNTALDEIAAAHGITPTGVAVAWIARHPAGIQTVLGTTRPERVAESAAGGGVQLSREEWYRLTTAAGHLLP